MMVSRKERNRIIFSFFFKRNTLIVILTRFFFLMLNFYHSYSYYDINYYFMS